MVPEGSPASEQKVSSFEPGAAGEPRHTGLAGVWDTINFPADSSNQIRYQLAVTNQAAPLTPRLGSATLRVLNGPNGAPTNWATFYTEVVFLGM